MNRFSLSYSELEIEVGKNPKKYGELAGLGFWRMQQEQSQTGQLALDDNTPESMEGEAAHSKMVKHDSRMSKAKRALSKAGIN